LSVSGRLIELPSLSASEAAAAGRAVAPEQIQRRSFVTPSCSLACAAFISRWNNIHVTPLPLAAGQRLRQLDLQG